jgi:hypothetical protein
MAGNALIIGSSDRQQLHQVRSPAPRGSLICRISQAQPRLCDNSSCAGGRSITQAAVVKLGDLRNEAW